MEGQIKTVLISLIVLLSLKSVTGQFIIRSIGREDLPETESLHYVSHTSDGKYWITSEKAILRFDGSISHVLPIHDPSRDIQLSEYPQSPLMLAPDGQFWITTYEGLHVFDSKKESFQTFQLKDGNNLITQDYRLLQVDPLSGEALLRAGRFLWTFQTKTKEYRKVAGPTQGTMFTSLSQDVWAAIRYDDTLEVYRQPPNGLSFEKEEYILPDRIMSVASENDHILWLGTKRGLARVDLQSPYAEIQYELLVQGGGTRSVLYGMDGNIWFTSGKVGVVRYSPVLEKVLDTIYPVNTSEIIDPQHLTQDNDGRIWIANYGQGFDIVYPEPKNFEEVDLNYESHLSDLHTPDGKEILAGDGYGNIQRLTGTSSPVPKTADIPSQNNGNHIARQLRFDAGGRQVWVGNQRQLGRYNPVKGDFIWYDRPDNSISDFYRSGDGLLAVLSQQGIMSVHPLGDSIKVSPLFPFPLSNGPRYTALFGVTDSTFLVCDRGAEIWPCKVRNGTVTINARLPIPGRPYAAIQWNHQVLLGTNNGLLEILDDTVATVLEKNPMGEILRIRSMIADEHSDNLYLGTTTGLIRYNPTTKKQTHFGKAEGLPDEEFLPADPVQLDNGTIWMATKSGIIRFHPDSLVIPKQHLTPYVSNLWVNDIAQPDEMIGMNLQRVERGYQKNSLSFRLGMIGLLPAGEGMVEYQLKDYDLAPIRVARNEVIRYPQLPPGTYELQLTAIDGRGERSGVESIAIVINPPIWETLWFRAAVLLALTLGAMLVYTSLLRRERRKQALIREREAMIIAERDRIAGEVHDDLGGQLSSIMFLSEELLVSEAAPAVGYELGRINELSQHSLYNIRDIIFALDNRRATVADLCEQVKTAGEEFFRDHKLGFSFNGHCTRGDRPLNSRQKRNLFSIVREPWHNTIKYAEAKMVTMDFDAGDEELTITITDDGKGMPTEQTKSSTGGYGLDNIKNKAKAIGGTLTVSSQPGQGTSITLQVPL